MKTYEEVRTYLTEKKADFTDISQPIDSKYMGDAVYDIEVNGDWKHSHRYIETLMNEIGYKQIFNHLLEPSDCDWYHSVHRFADEKMMELFR